MTGGDKSGDTEEEAVGPGGGLDERKGGLMGVGDTMGGGEPLCMAGDGAAGGVAGDGVACAVGGGELAQADVGPGGATCMAGDGYACITGWVWVGAWCVAARWSRKSRSAS